MVRALGYVLSNIGMDLPPGKQNNPMGLPTGKEIVETLVEFGALMYLGLVDDVAPSTKLETMIDDAEPEELEKLESVGEDGHWVDHLFGSWGGVFEDIKVGEVKKNSLGLVVFSGSGTDKEGKFCMYGQAMEGYRVRFVQLYESRGVVYEGKMAWNGDADRCRTRKGALAWAIRGRCWVLSEHFYDFWEGRPSESRRRLGGRFQMVKEPRSKFRE
ncbi:hypothetical protein QBC35DRAFT_504140 [Podospora australis]|uniref:Uncharacterized protein n=1 Tax=Podospora australis TaxID=1536484 RepID=A0AAN6WRY1_9PEZI|nr:hypothetical protein QBC35DRAFT_504140 [Podospora australis]